MSTFFPPKLKLHHHTPGWVPDGEIFHIRLRVERAQPIALTTPTLATALLNSARFYHEHVRWHCALFLLMPDHLHGLLAFPPPSAMSRTLGDWKKYHAQRHQVQWQDGYFDHRIRDAREFEEKAAYIRQNPVVKKLCARAADWPWVVDTLSF
ncbi:MAG: transposase [Verrucomicrobia bacterium]|nr:transposase [Verrucomicrobiota bacterium]